MLKALTILIPLFFIGCPENSYAQNDSTKKPLTIQTSVFTAIFKEGIIETVLPGKKTQGKIIAGLVYHNPFCSDLMMAWATTDVGLYSGFLAGGGIRINLPRFKAYYDFDLFYRYRDYFQERYYFGGVGGSSYAETLELSKIQNMLTLRAMYGLSQADRKKVNQEWYFGLGANIISEKGTQYDCRHCAQKFQQWNKMLIKPTFLVGYKLGLNFFQR